MMLRQCKVIVLMLRATSMCSSAAAPESDCSNFAPVQDCCKIAPDSERRGFTSPVAHYIILSQVGSDAECRSSCVELHQGMRFTNVGMQSVFRCSPDAQIAIVAKSNL